MSMANHYLAPPGGQLIPIELTSMVAEGGAGTVHRIVGQAGSLAKLYKEERDIPEYEQKIAAMLARPPNLPSFSEGGRNFVQIAWPTAAILNLQRRFVGFAMPEVDFQQSTELENILQKSARRRKGLPEFYGNRVLLGANLAALMASLHTLGHFMIDMKPMNMRFYPSRSFMAILDTDGFSIQGVRRWPARLFSDEYIAPEAATQRPENLGLEQDLFALAVIIFRLLNNGIHPYQGIDSLHSTHPTALQERVNAGLYGYARIAQNGTKPAHASIHEYFEETTRDLFDRAFGQQPELRPSALDWTIHLKDLVETSLKLCRTNPSEHAHFSRGCGLCALEARGPLATSIPRTFSRNATATRTTIAPINVVAPRHNYPPPRAGARSPPPGPPLKGILWGVAVLGLVVVVGSNLRPASPTRMPAPMPTTSAFSALSAQIKPCMAVPPGAAEAGVTTQLTFSLDSNGYVRGTPDIVATASSQLARALGAAAQRAVTRCAPYPMLANQTVNVQFDPREARDRQGPTSEASSKLQTALGDNRETTAMAARAQRALAALGCEPGPIDGLWGTSSKRALARLSERVRLPYATNPPDAVTVSILEGFTGVLCSLPDQSVPNQETDFPSVAPSVRDSWSDGTQPSVGNVLASRVPLISSNNIDVTLDEYSSFVRLSIVTYGAYLPELSSDRDLNSSFSDPVDAKYFTNANNAVCIFIISDGSICHLPSEPFIRGQYYRYYLQQDVLSDGSKITTWLIPKYVLSASCRKFSMSISLKTPVVKKREPPIEFGYSYSRPYSAMGDLFAESALGSRTIGTNSC